MCFACHYHFPNDTIEHVVANLRNMFKIKKRYNMMSSFLNTLSIPLPFWKRKRETTEQTNDKKIITNPSKQYYRAKTSSDTHGKKKQSPKDRLTISF